MSVTAESCQTYELWPLFILKTLVGGPNRTTSVSTFCPMYSCPNRATTSCFDAAQPPKTTQIAATRKTRIKQSPSPAAIKRNQEARAIGYRQNRVRVPLEK